jgi:uncharacterized protein
MEKTTIITKKKVKMKNPLLVEGLPGIGLVGKIAAEYLIKERKAERIAILYSPHFPHQVVMQKNGVVRMLKMKFFHAKAGGRDIIILVGDVQAVTSEAQYEVTGKILDYFHSLHGREIITLGGYGTGKAPSEPKVFGAATHKKVIAKYAKSGVEFGKTRGGIIGAAGLLLGLGRMRGMHGICLMGETHGGYVDPKSAQAVLLALSKILGVKIDIAGLAQKAEAGEKFMKKMESEAKKQAALQIEGGSAAPSDLSYIR